MDGPATQFGDEGEVVSVDAYAGEYERGPKRSVASIAHNSSGIPIPPLPGMTGRVADPLDNDGVDDLPF
jgi:hypothetical protein